MGGGRCREEAAAFDVEPGVCCCTRLGLGLAVPRGTEYGVEMLFSSGWRRVQGPRTAIDQYPRLPPLLDGGRKKTTRGPSNTPPIIYVEVHNSPALCFPEYFRPARAHRHCFGVYFQKRSTLTGGRGCLPTPTARSLSICFVFVTHQGAAVDRRACVRHRAGAGFGGAARPPGTYVCVGSMSMAAAPLSSGRRCCCQARPGQASIPVVVDC